MLYWQFNINFIHRVNTFPIIYDENTQSHFQTLESPTKDDKNFSELLSDQGTFIIMIFIHYLIKPKIKIPLLIHEIWFLADNLIADLLEPVELVEAEEIVIANCNIHQPEDLVFSPKVNFHEADTATLAMAPAKKGRERRFSVSLKEKALRFKKAFSLPRIGSISKPK